MSQIKKLNQIMPKETIELTVIAYHVIDPVFHEYTGKNRS